MDITIVGTGNMARAIGTRAAAGGHNLTIVGRDSESAEGAAQAVSSSGGEASIETAVSSDALGGDVVVLAITTRTLAPPSSSTATSSGKIVVDISNPLNETFDGLVVPPDGSATQELAGLVEGARVVKAFNTTFAGTLLAGEVGGNRLDVLIAGDDEEAKAAVSALARDGGLNPIDAGPQHRARELEAVGLLHITLQDTLGTGGASAVKFIA